MLSEERIILMTRLSAFADRRGRQDARMNGYYRSDYIGLNIVKSVISASVVFALILGVYAVYHFDTILQEFYTGKVLSQGMQLLISYVVLTGVYAVISYIVYSYRYKQMRRELKGYYSNLKKLENSYKNEE